VAERHAVRLRRSREETAVASSLLEAAFAHHAWATIGLIETCSTIGERDLELSIPGTRGRIVDTLRHVVDGDSGYLSILTGDPTPAAGEEATSLSSLRAAIERNAVRWRSLLSGPLDPDAIVLEVDPSDGYRREAPVAFRLAQALHHGSDHRSQICTALTVLGVVPPAIDVWDFGLEIGRIREEYAPLRRRRLGRRGYRRRGRDEEAQ
jgi:uncharacterized damage-inducible protein DinB